MEKHQVVQIWDLCSRDPHNQSLHNKESLLVLRLFNFPSELSCHFKAHIMTFTGTNHCQCPLEHVPNINKDIKICNFYKLLPCSRCIWGISPPKLWLKMFWITAILMVLEKRWSRNSLRIQWCWGWLGCWRSADIQLASYKVHLRSIGI